MPRTHYKGLSDSDSSSDEEEVVNFKRARKTSHNETEGSGNCNKPGNIPLIRAPQPSTSKSGPSGATVNPSLLLSNGYSAGRRYIDRDRVDGDISVPPGRSLANPSAMKAVIDLERRKVVNPTPIPIPKNGPAGGGGGPMEKVEPLKTELSSTEIMQVMGFENGKGLAKYLAEAEAKKPDPKFSIDEFDEKADALGICLADMELQTLEDVSLKEEIKWINCLDPKIFKVEELIEGRKLGPVITSVEIDEANAFIDPWVYKELIECKKLYQNMSQIMYQRVRSKSNLFERVAKGPFISRAAMKMANLDVILGNELTQPKTQQGVPAVSPNELFYFGDICAGPGGFSEYTLWKKKWEAKGFGLTLKGELDFDVKNFIVEPETFEAFYGEAGDGNIYNPANVNGYIKHVLQSTDGHGLNLLMADGGFTVSKQEFLQEVLSQHIILSQIFVALATITVGGHFVCKLFDAVTPVTVALIYLVHQCFDSVAIHKLLTSRPANSERYLICKWKKSNRVTVPIVSYLADCHHLMWNLMTENEDAETKMAIVELIPTSAFTSVALTPFYIYMRDCNNRLAKKQIEALKRMVAFVRDDVLENEKSQEKARKAALQYWNVPEKIPMPAVIRTCDRLCKDMLEELPLTMLRHLEKDLNPDNIELLFKSAYDWRFVPVTGIRKSANNPNRGFYMSLGQNLVYRYDGLQWVIIAQSEPLLEFPSKTLVYGEFVHEIYGRAAADQTIIMTFHIIDALQLGGMDIRNMHYTQRLEMCRKFAKAVTKPGTLPVHAKTAIRMEELGEFITKLENRVVKGAGVGAKLVCPFDMRDPYAPYVIPQGLLFLKITKDPWQMALNRTTRKKYFFNTMKGVPSEQIPEDAIAGFFNTMGNRTLWSWDSETNVIITSLTEDDPRIALLSPYRLHTCNLLTYINYTIRQQPSVSPPRTTLYIANAPQPERVAKAVENGRTIAK